MNENILNHTANKILLFDGYCNLCSRSISFLRKNLRKHDYSFVPSKSEEGENLIRKYNLSNVTEHSIVLIVNNKIFTKSDALLEIIDDMRTVWKLLKFLRIVPKSFRNRIYDLTSKYRHIILKNKFGD